MVTLDHMKYFEPLELRMYYMRFEQSDIQMYGRGEYLPLHLHPVLRLRHVDSMCIACTVQLQSLKDLMKSQSRCLINGLGVLLDEFDTLGPIGVGASEGIAW